MGEGTAYGDRRPRGPVVELIAIVVCVIDEQTGCRVRDIVSLRCGEPVRQESLVGVGKLDGRTVIERSRSVGGLDDHERTHTGRHDCI